MNIIGLTFEGRKIAALHDLCTGAGYNTKILLSVQYEDGEHDVLVFETKDSLSSRLSHLEIDTGEGITRDSLQMLLDIDSPARLSIDTDCGYYEVRISTGPERYLIAREERQEDGSYPWRVVGTESSGATAVKEMERHGVTFSAEVG